MSKFAAYDDDGIWGVGDTEEEARTAAAEYLRGAIPEDEAEAALPELKTAAVSDDLLAELADYEGNAASIADVPFELEAGVLILVSPESME